MPTGQPTPQSTLGPYELLASLDRGGVGEVYRAWDPRLQREVAVKILHDRSDVDSQRLLRFVAEARAASALNHPNIVTVFDAAVGGDTPYIVTELIDGRRLREELRGGALPVKRLLDFAAQIADGLAAAHEARIVHRDLKPENIMVARTGRLKIVDFGLARSDEWQDSSVGVVTDDAQTQTEVGLRAGTVPYMSPEQARGTATDFRTDQFSFGLILYEMATGRSAFRRDTPAATLDAIINEDLPPDPAFDTRMPAPFRWIVERCLAKDPNERYAVTADLYRDLRTLRDRLGEVSARDVPQSTGGRTGRLRRAVIAAAAVAVAIAALVAGINRPEPADSPAEPRFAPLATGPGYEGLPAWSPDGQTIAYAAAINDTLQIFTRRLSSATPAQVTQAPYDCKHPFWSPDGKRIYYVSLARDRESLWSIGAAGGTPQVVIENASRGAISPDGRTLAFLRDEEGADIVGASALWLSSPVAAEPMRYEPLDPLRINEAALAFSPDGASLGLSLVPRSINVESAARGWQFWTVPMNGGRPVRRLQSLADVAPRVTGFSWLPDARHVVLGLASLTTTGSHLWMADLDHDLAWSLTRGPGSESYPSTSPQGDQVVFGAGDPDYDVVEVALGSGAARPLLETTRNESDPVWSPDGSTFAYATDRNGRDEIWLRSRDGRAADRPLITQADFGDDRTIMLSSPSFSPDGKRIAYQRNASKPIWPLRIWISQTEGGPPVPLLPPEHEGYESAPTWSPDGQWIAFTERKERQWLLAKVRVGSGEGPIVLRTDGVANAAPSWSPNGDWITWETDSGLMLASPDGGGERRLADGQMLAHTWSGNGADIVGIRETEQLRLSLVRIDVRTGRERTLADLGAAPPVNNAVKGLSVSRDGRTVVTSIVRLRGDLWLLQNLAIPREPAPWFGRLRSP